MHWSQIDHGPWVPSLGLTAYDKGCVESREGLLCDKHMMAASKILADDFPQLQGLQSTLLYQTDGFSPISIQPSAGCRTEGN